MKADALAVRTGPTVMAAVGMMVLSAACWGSATVMSKSLLETFSPPALLVLQLTASVAFLWAAVGTTGQGVRLDAGARRAALSGLLEPGFAYVLGTFGLMLTTAGNASLIGATEPMLVVALAWLLFRERIAARTGAAILGAMVGVGLVTGAHPTGGGSLAGDALVVLGTLFAALYVVASSRAVTRIGPLPLAALQQTVGLGFALAFLFVWSPLTAFADELARADLGVIAFALLSGVVQYALAFWLYLVGLQRLPAGTAALILTLIPVFGLGGAVLFLGEAIQALQAIGAAVIIGAVASRGRSFAE